MHPNLIEWASAGFQVSKRKTNQPVLLFHFIPLGNCHIMGKNHDSPPLPPLVFFLTPRSSASSRKAFRLGGADTHGCLRSSWDFPFPGRGFGSLIRAPFAGHTQRSRPHQQGPHGGPCNDQRQGMIDQARDAARLRVLLVSCPLLCNREAFPFARVGG